MIRIAHKILTFSLVSLALLGCGANSSGQQSKVNRSWDRTYMVGYALSANPVMERDVASFKSFWTTRFGRPEHSYVFGYRSPSLRKPTQDATRDAMRELAKLARPNKDLIVIHLAGSGNGNGLTIDPGDDTRSSFSSREIRNFLDPISGQKQLIVISACDTGNLAKRLPHPNRVIILAASGGGSALYCNPQWGANSIYITALTHHLQGGGSLKEIMDRAHVEAATQQRLHGIASSEIAYPQIIVGKQMIPYWTDTPAR